MIKIIPTSVRNLKNQVAKHTLKKSQPSDNPLLTTTRHKWQRHASKNGAIMQSTMTRITLILFLAAACGRSPISTSQLAFDAEHSVALDGIITNGRIITSSSSDSSIRYEIGEQLLYSIGQLNGLNGAPDLQRLDLSLVKVTQRSDGRYEVAYQAKLFISWPREREIPLVLNLILPAASDWRGQNAFVDAYGEEGSACIDPSAADVSAGNFWYYYRPSSPGCPLNSPAQDDPELVVRLALDLQVSKENTNGKFPEYGKVWEDGKLVATAIFGKDKAGSTSTWDAGVTAYREFYHSLLASYGLPSSTNLAPHEEPDAKHNDVRLVFPTAAGVLDVHIYLVDGIRLVDGAFRQKYSERTKISDFVGYSGHSGLGANIRALASMGTFLPGQYQIFLVNGCDTFAYVDNALRDAHQQANPESGANKYFDVITNAMPAYFHENANATLAIIDGLVGQAQTYREILASFDQAQRAAVTGEEDNLWPLPFD